ncbi:MAG: NADH-ubiquinone oxidoreductase-F iron-sulfur binding region domain-containing protein [Candidatus Latescibacterota bacterium]
MERLVSLNDYLNLRDRILGSRDPDKPTIVIPAGTCGQASGANDLIRIAKRELLAQGLTEHINLKITGCHGFCEMEPSVLVKPYNIFYPKVKGNDIVRIVNAVKQNVVLNDLLFIDPHTGRPVYQQSDIPFFKKQVRTVLGQNENIDPIRIYNYIEHEGYAALTAVLERRDPEWVIAEVKKSGLRGRGGGGFPTGLKWEMLSKQKSSRGKYLICNGDEGDPGAYMDRSLLEGNPHSIIEGMIIGAFGAGASEGIIYVRHEYPLAIKHLTIALRQAREAGLLGNNILGSGFSFDIQLTRGAGAFVCGEETALIKSIEGKIGEPRQRPPYPIQKGVQGRPTAINNVETWANIPVIFRKGAEEYAQVGTKNNSGTKIFSLVGKVKYTGLVEAPMGSTIDEIVNDMGGGPSGAFPIKAIQIGGPSGGCIPKDRFHLPIDYDSLREAGAIMGSGGMIVLDETSCMVDLAKYFMHFLKDESCGKCFPCRKGTQRMYELVDDISKGIQNPGQVELLEDLAQTVKDATMCGLGQTAANPVLSTIRYFREEYMDHIQNRRCTAGVCRDIINYSINDNCRGCMSCLNICPELAISGKGKEKHVINQDICIRCGSCKSVCRFEAIEVH